MSIQIFLASHRFDLFQDRRDALVVTRDRNPFAAAGVLAISYGHNDDIRFGPSTASNAKRLIKRPTLLVGVEANHSALSELFPHGSKLEIK